MANVCPRCSTENADGVLVCRQCGTSLAPPAGWSRSLIPDDDNFDPLSAPTLVMRHTVPADLPPLQSILIPPEPKSQPMVPMLVLGLAALAVAIGAGLWLSRSGEPAEAPAARPGPAAAAPAELPLRTTPAPDAPATEASAPHVAAAVPPPPSASVAAVPPLPAPSGSGAERRKRVPEPPSRAAAAEAVPVPAPPEPEIVVPPPAPVPSEPVKLKTVNELCSAGSLLSRGFCEHRECAKPENASDPVCVRIKEAEEARRFRQ